MQSKHLNMLESIKTKNTSKPFIHWKIPINGSYMVHIRIIIILTKRKFPWYDFWQNSLVYWGWNQTWYKLRNISKQYDG